MESSFLLSAVWGWRLAAGPSPLTTGACWRPQASLGPPPLLVCVKA